MFSIIDNNNMEWTLCERTMNDGVRLLELEGHESANMVLDHVIAQELIVRLRFFLEHGRLPREGPDHARPECYHFYCLDCERKFVDGDPKTIDGPECPRCGRATPVIDWDDFLQKAIGSAPKGISRACDEVYLHNNNNKHEHLDDTEECVQDGNS